MQTSFVAIFVGILIISTAQQTLIPYDYYEGYYPGGTHDIGIVSSTDIIKIDLQWIIVLD